MPSKEPAKALAPTQNNMDHLTLHACSLRRMNLVSFARTRASNPMKRRVSSDHLLATSPASTTNFTRALGWTNSGYVLSFHRLARTRAAPSESARQIVHPHKSSRQQRSPTDDLTWIRCNNVQFFFFHDGDENKHRNVTENLMSNNAHKLVDSGQLTNPDRRV